MNEWFTILATESIVTKSLNGPLDVRGGDSGAALLIGGRIFALCWHDCKGSVGQHLVRETTPNCSDSVTRFRKSVSAPLKQGESLASHFSEVLPLLAAGQYRLDLEEIPADSYVVELPERLATPRDVKNFYPGFGAMVATQPGSRIEEWRVKQILMEVHAGARPTVITLESEGSWQEFILDGHHKLRAYRLADVPIRRLSIIRLDSPPLDQDLALEFIPEETGLREHFVDHRPDFCQ